MNIQMSTGHVAFSADHRRHVEQWLAEALGRFKARIAHVALHFDTAGARTVHCGLHAVLQRPAGRIHVDASGNDPDPALRRAVERLRRRLRADAERLVSRRQTAAPHEEA